MTRPNLLFVTSDQQRGDCYGFAGRSVRTPHLDELKERGTWLSGTITPNPVCQPSRAAILTGLLPNTNGVWDNGVDLDPAVGEAGFAGRLGRAGYDTAFVGKAHFSTVFTFEPTGTPESMHSSVEYDEDWNGPYMGFEHVELVTLGHPMPPFPPPYGQHYERWFAADGRKELRDAQYNTRLGPEGLDVPQTFESGLPPAWHTSTWVADRTIDWIREHRASERPWCLWASFPDPHHPFDAPVPWSRLHHLDEVDLPPHFELDLDRRPWWHRASLEAPPDAPDLVRQVREKFSRLSGLGERELRHVIANYYGMIALIDHNVGRILGALDRLGVAEDTVVVYTSDHGEWLGDHGLMLKGPMPYDGLLRVGMLLAGPGIPSGREVHDPVSTLDVGATLGDLAGLEDNPTHGASLLPVVRGDERREFAYDEWDVDASRCGVPLRLRTVRTATHRLTLELDSGDGELYDLVEDPHEMDNRFDDPALAGVRSDLEDLVRQRPDDALPELPARVGMS